MKKARFVHGSRSTAYRQKTLDMMRSGKRGVYISTLYDEGVDVPDVQTLILAAGGKAQNKVLQRVGRGLRAKDDGRNVVNVVDFNDSGNSILLKHSKERQKIYEQEGFEITFVRNEPAAVS